MTVITGKAPHSFINCTFVQSLLLSGIYSAFPYVFLACVVPAGGFVADMMRLKKVSTIIVRKIMTLSGELNRHKTIILTIMCNYTVCSKQNNTNLICGWLGKHVQKSYIYEYYQYCLYRRRQDLVQSPMHAVFHSLQFTITFHNIAYVHDTVNFNIMSYA